MKSISEIVNAQKSLFKSQITKDIDYRLSHLKALKVEILANEKAILDGLNKDFKKSEFEGYLSEFGLVISELNLAINSLKKWAKPKRIGASILTFPSKDYISKNVNH